MEKDGLDVYHGLSHELPLGIQKTAIKSVVTIHDLIFKIYPKTYKAFDRMIYDHKFKYACQKSDKIVAISESTKNDIVDFYGIDEDKIEVVYQACSPLYLDLQSAEAVKKVKVKYQLPENYLLYVGSVIERKGLLKIIQALELIKKEDRLPLVIVGEGGSYAEKVKKYADEKGLERWLIWISVQENAELQAFYQGAKIFIYPSIYEGFGIPVVEALLSKTPVITSNVSSLPEAAGPNSICVNPNNPAELSTAIIQILGDSVLQEKMKLEGRIYAESMFNNEIVTAKMMKIYEGLVG
jgi:glycosyltransferase involved in cell wall biosynthesis